MWKNISDLKKLAISKAGEFSQSLIEGNKDEEEDSSNNNVQTKIQTFETDKSTKESSPVIKNNDIDPQAKIEELCLNIENLEAVILQKDCKIKELQKNIDDLQDNRKKFVLELTTRDNEIEKLKNKLKNLKDDETNKSSQLSQLEAQVELIPTLNEELEELKGHVTELNEKLVVRNQEVEDLQNGLTNLQTILEESQQAQDMIIKKYDVEIKRLRNDIEALRRKNDTLKEYKSKYEEMEKIYTENKKLVKELDLQLKATEQEKNEIKQESTALLKKLKSDAIYKENLVDKRVVNKFLVSYFDLNTTYHVKLQILETLSSILSFTEEEKQKMGLTKAGLQRHNTEDISSLLSSKFKDKDEDDQTLESNKESPIKSLKNKFLNFLMEEEDDEEEKN